MTGRYPQTNGLMGLIQPPYHWRFNSGERHLSHRLAEAGYHTVLFNHQHEAPHEESLGFAEFRAHDTGGYRLLTGEHVHTAEETAEALGVFLNERKHADCPFYAQAGFFETHVPSGWSGAEADDPAAVRVPPHAPDTPETRAHIAGLTGAVRSLDTAVGGILKALSDTGLDRRTILVFTVDHGVELPHCKWELYDGGIHTALLMTGPDALISPATVCDDLVSNVDLVPSLLDLAGIPVPEDMEGQSFAGALRGQDEQARTPRGAVFAMMHGHHRWTESRCVRTDRYKFIRNFSPSRTLMDPCRPASGKQKERPVVELYDLEADPHECHDLGQDPAYAATRRQLDRQLLQWMRTVKDPILDGPVRTPYYRMAMRDVAEADTP